jgi:hypothetical protein
MERAFSEISEENIEFFKENIFCCYLADSQVIRKTIANLINTFVKLGGLEKWPEILNILLNLLQNKECTVTVLETMHIIIEDSGNVIEEKYSKVNKYLILL